MTLLDKQWLFAELLGKFITWIYSHPEYKLVGGDWHRTPAQAAVNVSTGAGILHTLHALSLAQDFSLFINGVYQTESAPYRPLGEYWKTLHPLCRWGGDFVTRQDGGHFSIEHEGVR